MAACILCGCGGSKPALTPQQDAALKAFAARCQTGTGVIPETEMAQVVAIGDPAVPYLEEILYGNGEPPAPDDYIVIVALARIATPASILSIANSLNPDKPLLSPFGLETAADALVCLGATGAAPALTVAIGRVEREIQDRRRANLYRETPDKLKRSLERLQNGEGKEDTADFPIRRAP
ncbi:MAG: hypothetical protein GY851_00210 [bacterium]|nr:hypothetical protein [bacterium]